MYAQQLLQIFLQTLITGHQYGVEISFNTHQVQMVKKCHGQDNLSLSVAAAEQAMIHILLWQRVLIFGRGTLNQILLLLLLLKPDREALLVLGKFSGQDSTGDGLLNLKKTLITQFINQLKQAQMVDQNQVLCLKLLAKLFYTLQVHYLSTVLYKQESIILITLTEDLIVYSQAQITLTIPLNQTLVYLINLVLLCYILKILLHPFHQFLLISTRPQPDIIPTQQFRLQLITIQVLNQQLLPKQEQVLIKLFQQVYKNQIQLQLQDISTKVVEDMLIITKKIINQIKVIFYKQQLKRYFFKLIYKVIFQTKYLSYQKLYSILIYFS